MCTVCGCGEGETRVEGQSHHHHGHNGHHHHHGETKKSDQDLDFGQGPARAHVPGMSQERMVQIEQDILSKNDTYAEKNRQRFLDKGIFALNLVSSPGSGKTTLLTETIKALQGRLSVAVIEGDQQTTNDADRIRETGAKALQINTGKGCHLDAHMVGHAAEHLALADRSVLMIENVGNLVCPAAFDLGENHKVAILSVTEGEDKPLKYPDMFHAADLMLLNKIDLLPHLDFDVEKCIGFARQVNPDIEVMQVSATRGQGMGAWLDWISAGLDAVQTGQVDSMDSLRQKNTELEAELAALRSQLKGA